MQRFLTQFFSFFDDPSQQEITKNFEDRVGEEIRAYKKLEFPLILMFCKGGRATNLIFQDLAVLARKYLCITATSVPSERVFSKGGKIVTDDRRCLTGEHVEELIFLS